MTEKNYNPGQKQKKSAAKQNTAVKMIEWKEPKAKEHPKPEEKVAEEKLEIKEEVKTPTEDVKETIKKTTTPKIKKPEAVVNALGAPISTKDSMAI